MIDVTCPTRKRTKKKNRRKLSKEREAQASSHEGVYYGCRADGSDEAGNCGRPAPKDCARPLPLCLGDSGHLVGECEAGEFSRVLVCLVSPTRPVVVPERCLAPAHRDLLNVRHGIAFFAVHRQSPKQVALAKFLPAHVVANW